MRHPELGYHAIQTHSRALRLDEASRHFAPTLALRLRPPSRPSFVDERTHCARAAVSPSGMQCTLFSLHSFRVASSGSRPRFPSVCLAFCYPNNTQTTGYSDGQRTGAIYPIAPRTCSPRWENPQTFPHLTANTRLRRYDILRCECRFFQVCLGSAFSCFPFPAFW